MEKKLHVHTNKIYTIALFFFPSYMVIKAVQEHSIGCFTGNGCRNIDVVIDGNTKREKCHSIWWLMLYKSIVVVALQVTDNPMNYYIHTIEYMTGYELCLDNVEMVCLKKGIFTSLITKDVNTKSDTSQVEVHVQSSRRWFLVA